MRILIACLAMQFFSGALAALPKDSQSKPLVIAHRGASGYLPEHTLEAYRMAMRMGADIIETDLVVTKDAVLVARHEPNIIDTTDVSKHPEFANRRVRKSVDGIVQEGFFVEDFTLAELKTLRAVQTRPGRDQTYNGLFEIPTLAEVIDAVQSFERESGRRVGIYPETKHPSHFRAMGLPLEENLVAVLESKGFTDPDRVFIQSFEVGNLKDILRPMLASKGLKIPLVQIFGDLTQKPYDYAAAGIQTTYGDLAKAESLKSFVATYATVIGPWKVSVTEQQPTMIADAHAAGLLLIPYTFRDDDPFPSSAYLNPESEYLSFFAAGVDGVITDFTDTALRARARHQLQAGANR